jgi:hypothetical protein
LDLRRDLFGLGSEALFVSTKGAREAGLEGRIIPADLARYPAAKLLSEGAGEQDAVGMIGYICVHSCGTSMPLTAE